VEADGQEVAGVAVLAEAEVSAGEAAVRAAVEQAGVGDMKARDFLKELHQEKIVAAIGKAEKHTTGEIRVFISRHEPADAIAAAQAEFSRMGMEKTKDKNAVLIYVAPHVRKFAIIGDAGVHQRCGQQFWDAVAVEMTGHFKKSNFTDGILHGIHKAGELLAQHFPGKPNHPNQLSDDVEHD
jgi:uncharacterized membrane protein